MNMNNWELEQWINANVPNKQSLSRDATEILIKLAWEASQESAIRRKKADEEYERNPDI